MRRNFLCKLAAGLLVSTLPLLGSAQAYPTKPIKVIVPATPGGTSDILMRALAPRLQEALGKPIIIEYKPGAATNIGTDFVAKAAPDGYTLLINGLPLSTSPALFSNLPFNPQKDLTPVIEIATITNVVTVHPSVPANTLKELVELIKASPGKFNHGTPGVGSSGFLSAELFNLKAGTKITHIAYQGNAQATTDHIGGVLQVGFVNLPVALQFVKAGKLKALAVTSSKRTDLFPGVPTVAEALGVEYDLSGWFGLVAPAKTPPEIIARLQHEVNLALKDPAIIEVIKSAGADVVGGSSADFGARMRFDAERLTDVIRRSGVQGQ
jgi:tripartite-type tricarboxylate transporter receptor subunit TctC